MKRILKLYQKQFLLFSQDFTKNGGLSGWIISGSASVIGGALVITPTALGELLADPGLEATYTAGLCASLGKAGSPTLAQSANVHSGAKAQQITPTANADFVRYVGPAAIAGRWYLASMWAKRTAGTAGTLCARLLHGNGTGAIGNRRPIVDVDYTQYFISSRAISTNNLCVYMNQLATTPFDTAIGDDFSMKLLTTSTMGIYKLAGSVNYEVGVVPAFVNQGEPYGVWICVDNPTNPQNGILAWYEGNVVYLDKYVGGTLTNLLSVTRANYFSNTIEGVRSGNDYSLWEGGSQRGATQTGVTDIGTCPYVGIFTGYLDVTISRFDQHLDTYTVNIWGYGDSRISAQDSAQAKLGAGFREVPTRVGVGGKNVADMKARIDADISAATGTPNIIHINLGVNDLGTNGTTWKNNYAYILDAMHTKWPLVRIGVTIPWKSGSDTDSDARAVDMATVLTTRPFASVAVDERLVIKPYADRLAADNIHPTTLGYYNEALSILDWNK